MKLLLLPTTFAVLFCHNIFCQCPESLSYGDPSWPNKITMSDGASERIFYFQEMVAIQGEGRFWLKSPIFQGNREGYDMEANSIQFMYFADEAEPDYPLSFSNFELGTNAIDCFEMPEAFGKSSVFYQRSIAPGNYRIDEGGQKLMSATFEMRSKRDDSFITASLNKVYIVPLRVPAAPDTVLLATAPDTLRGHITYNKVYNPDTRDRAGLTVRLVADTLHRFSLFDFKGRPGIFHFMDQLFEVSEFGPDGIVIDRYIIDGDRVNEISATTFFDFNLAATLATLFPKEERTHLYRLEGPYHIFSGMGAVEPESLLNGYRYDMHDAMTDGGGYRFFQEPAIEEQLLEGSRLVQFAPAYLTELVRADNQFEYRETLDPADGGYALTAGMVSLERKKKKGQTGPRSENASLDMKGNFRNKMLAEPRGSMAAEIHQADSTSLRIAAENEEQGRESTIWNRSYSVPDILQMPLLLSSVAWEEGMALEMEFQDFNLLQSSKNSVSSMGRVSYTKRTVVPVQAMVKAKAVAAEEVKGRAAWKVAVYTKDFGMGTPLLKLLVRSVPSMEPYQLAGYFWFAADNPGLIQVADAEGNVIFTPK